MDYYYNISGENKGPVSLDELHDLARQGVIKGKTPVIEKGGSQWTRYDRLATADGLELPAAPTSLLERQLSINPAIDRLLSRLFHLPSFIPADDEARLNKMNKLADIVGLTVWAAHIAVGIGLMASPLAKIVPGALILLLSVIVGFVIQYIAYQMYRMTNSLIVGPKIALSSLGFPRLLGFFWLLGSLVALVMVFVSTGVADISISVCEFLICVTSCYLCLNAGEITVDVEQAKVSPGREINNVFLFILRNIFTVLHVLAPVLIVVSALGLAMTIGGDSEPPDPYGYSRSSSLGDLLQVGSMTIFFIYLPLFNYFGLCLSSWIFDLYGSILSLGDNKR